LRIFSFWFLLECWSVKVEVEGVLHVIAWVRHPEEGRGEHLKLRPARIGVLERRLSGSHWPDLPPFFVFLGGNPFFRSEHRNRRTDSQGTKEEAFFDKATENSASRHYPALAMWSKIGGENFFLKLKKSGCRYATIAV
jgi:hypothetical protein